MVYCLNPSCPEPQNPSAANFCQACGTPLILADETLPERYQLTGLLAQGGSGRTFLAQRLASDTAKNNPEGTSEDGLGKASFQCIVKQIYRQPSVEDTAFKAEAARLQKLGEHPQIPALLAAIENELGQFLVQAFVPGDRLGTQIEKKGPQTEAQVRSLLTSLVPVLQYVHSFDVIHRDIKPDNIILATDGDRLPSLVDFGSAKWVRKALAKTVIGSAEYAAPEQSIGQATFASDIYSLGLTCLHALSGIHPFSLYSAAEDSWVWRDYLPQPIEPRFAQLLDRMVARSLQQRYENMDQVALDLQFSSNSLLRISQQLFSRAQDAVAPLKSALQTGVGEVASRIVVTNPQIWRRREHLCQASNQPIGKILAIAISPRMPIFATAGNDGSVRLWHLLDGQLFHTFPRRRLIGNGHTAAITALKFHPDGRAFYSASADGTIKEWDSQQRCWLNTLPTAGWEPTALVITPDGTQLISAYSDGQIIVWDIATLRPVAQLTQHQKGVRAIALAPRYNLLASASDDGTIKLWQYPWRHPQKVSPQLAKTISLDQQSHKPFFKEKIASLQSSSPGIAAIAFNEQQQPLQLIVTTTAGLVQIYRLDAQLNPSEPTVLYQSPLPLTAFALSSDGTLAVGSEDKLLTLWDITTGECVATLAHDWGVSEIAFSPDGKTLITAGHDEVISIWDKDED
ncbi:MAG: WD40 repeat domain-containing serine/threonine-protein kinase [Phormidesmis sp.]